MTIAVFTENATIPVGGTYNSSLYILGNILSDNTQELIPLLTTKQIKNLVFSFSKAGFKVYNTTLSLMYSWNGTGWVVTDDAVSSTLVTNTSSGQTLVDISGGNTPIVGQTLIATSSKTAVWSDIPTSGGSGGSSSQIAYNQIIPSNVWTIVHNLHKYPVVVVADSAGTIFIGDIDYISDMSLVITFSASFGGTAYLT